MGTRSSCLCLLVVCAAAGCAGSSREEVSEIDSVLLISIDTLRPDYLGAYDSQRLSSPHIDRFAEEGVVFLDALAQGSSTAISHKSILYSLYPTIHQTSFTSAPDETLTSPVEELRRSGLSTGAFVGGGQLHPAFGFTRGFEDYVVKLKGQEKPLENLRDRALAWLRDRGDDPFFLFVHSYQVHGPYDPPEPYRSKHAGWYEGSFDPSAKGWSKIYDRDNLSADETKLVRDLYTAQIEYVDDFIRDLFEGMRELGVWNSTLVVFLSDHGQSLGEDGLWGHNQLVERQLRIPLIVRIPGIEAARIEAPVESVDVMPTIFSALGIEPPFEFQGRDLLPAMRGRESWPAERVRIAETNGRVSIRDSEWKIVISRTSRAEQIFMLQGVEEALWEGEPPPAVSELKSAYSRTMRSAGEIAESFVPTGIDPKKNRRAMKQLKALGYVD